MANEKPLDTVKFPPPPDWAIALASKIEDSRKEQREAANVIQADVTALKATVARIADDQVAIVTRVSTLEGWKEGTVSRLDQSSLRARSMSEVDTKHDSNFATIFAEQAEIRGELAKNTTATNTIASALTDQKSGAMIVYEDLKKSPTFQRVMYAFAIFLLAALSYGALALDNLARKIPHAAPAQMQP